MTFNENVPINEKQEEAKNYVVEARQSGLTKEKASDTAAYLQKLGMTVIVKED